MTTTLTPTGRTMLITGATNGIGKETARQLALMGHTVVVVGRDPAKTEAVVRELQTATGNPNVASLLADLSLLADVRALAEAFKARYSRLDVLVNNAGTIYMQRTVTREGLEATWALNHLAYFLLTHLLWDVLASTPGARVVNVASSGHKGGRIDFDDLQAEHGRYRGFSQYNNTKLANVLFTRELARRGATSGVTANAVHPGFVPAAFTRERTLGARLFLLLTRPFAKTIEQGAQTSVHVAISPDVAGVSGAYFADCRAVSPSAAAQDDAVATRLWQVSATQTGLTTTL